ERALPPVPTATGSPQAWPARAAAPPRRAAAHLDLRDHSSDTFHPWAPLDSRAGERTEKYEPGGFITSVPFLGQERTRLTFNPWESELVLMKMRNLFSFSYLNFDLSYSLLTEEQTNKTNTAGCAIWILHYCIDIAALEQVIRDAQECDDGEIQLYNEQIDTLRKETEEAERSLERSSYDCQQLVVAQQTLRNELDRCHRIIENTGNRQWQPTPVLLPGKSHGQRSLVGCSPWDLTRDVQDITALKPRLKGLPKNLPRKKDMVAKDRADEILEETPLRGPEDTKPGWVVLKEEGKSKLELGDEEANGGKISKDFEKLGKMIKENVKGPKEPEPPADLYTKRRYMTVSGDASLMGPGFCVFSIPAKGACSVEPSPQQPEHPLEDGQGSPRGKKTGKEHGCPPTTHPADKGHEKNAKELKGLQGKQDDQKEEEGDRRPCPIVAPGPEGLSTPRSQGPQVTLVGSKGRGAQSGSRPKVEVIESIDKFSTGSIQMYEETVIIVETMIEKTRQTRNWERRDPPVPELTRRRCLWAPADMCFDVLEQRLQG
ncbi:hypothetical protein FD755_004970, partial [Muntiacus reevesi]